MCSISLTIDEVSSYLHMSELYLVLKQNDSIPFDILDKYYKNTVIINTNEDLILYLHIFDYWGLSHI